MPFRLLVDQFMDAIILARDVSEQKYVYWKASRTAILAINNQDGDTRIRLLYYNLSNDHSIRSCRHGAILIPVFVIKSFTGKSRIEYARKFNGENTDRSTPVDSGKDWRKSSFNIKLLTQTHRVPSGPVSSFTCQYLPSSLVLPPLSPLLRSRTLLVFAINYVLWKARVPSHSYHIARDGSAMLRSG